MSRELRILRSAELQLAAHHHHLSQHEMRAVATRAQMRALQAQINPHFLFNTLNVLASLIQSDPEKAERVTEELADIFRYALESTRHEWVKLDDELRFLESYLEIETARFGARLVYIIEVESELRLLKIPPMILQPLVENAIKHGIGSRVSGGRVRISGWFDADRVILSVEDTGTGEAMSPRYRGAGVGLSNVRERLEHLYGAGGVLRLEPVPEGGTRATLVLPQLAAIEL
jgi:LytS/YehU family sensor histidine kinase